MQKQYGGRMRNWGLGLLTVGCLFLGACNSSSAEEVTLQTIQPIVPESTTQEEPESSSVESVSTVTEPERIAITITAAGDVTMGNYEGQDYAWSFRETYASVEDKKYFFENVYDIFAEDDMTIVNLEGVLTTSDKLNPGRTYNIKGDPEYAEILSLGSIEAVSMANNHRLDFYESGTEDTLAALAPWEITYAYDNNIGIYETKGIRIGYVSVNEIGWGQGEIEKQMKNGIAKLNEEGVDLILACCHWGIERENYPTDFQQSFGHKCIDWGADLVIGHHPHVIQGVEEYQGKYILYSLANFCFGANRNPKDKDTIIAQQTFYFEDGVKLEESEFRIIPCSVSSVSSRNDYKPTPAEDEAAERILGRMNEYSAPFKVQFDEEGKVLK